MWEDGHSAIRAQRRSRGVPPAPQLSVRCAGGARRGCRGRTDLWEGTKLGHRMEVPVAMAMRLAVGFLDWGPGVASADQRKRRLGGMVAGIWRSQGPCFSQVLWGLLLKMPSHMLFPVVLRQFRGSPGFPGPNGAPESRGGRGRLVSTRRLARTLLAVPGVGASSGGRCLWTARPRVLSCCWKRLPQDSRREESFLWIFTF